MVERTVSNPHDHEPAKEIQAELSGNYLRTILVLNESRLGDRNYMFQPVQHRMSLLSNIVWVEALLMTATYRLPSRLRKSDIQLGEFSPYNLSLSLKVAYLNIFIISKVL